MLTTQGQQAGGDKYDSYNACVLCLFLRKLPSILIHSASQQGEVADEGRHCKRLGLHSCRRSGHAVLLPLLRSRVLSLRVRLVTSALVFCAGKLKTSAGVIPHRSECSFLHRLPQPEKALPDNSRDVFGREKHAGYRDDMGGVGSFGRINRTLYIGRVTETRSTEEVVERHFEEFGDIDRLRVLSGRNVAFVTYVSEVSAQFAKEAMMHQSLDNDEVLNVRCVPLTCSFSSSVAAAAEGCMCDTQLGDGRPEPRGEGA